MKKTIITNLCVGLFLLTACTINDNPIVGPDDHGEGAKDYVERMVPVVDPQNNPQGMVTLRFYNDMLSEMMLFTESVENSQFCIESSFNTHSLYM